MSVSYRELLDSTVAYLEDLREQGRKFVPVSAETLAVLDAPAVAKRNTPSPRAAPNRPKAPAFRQAAAAPPQPTPTSSAPIVVPGLEGLFSDEPELSREKKEAANAELRAKVLACEKCPHLVAARKNVVFGVGDIHSSMMFVGEAPGADEDLQGEPFVGKAGQLLTKIIQTMGLDRDKVFIANILKCRPDTPGQRYGNRKPRPEEMDTCKPYLMRQIEIIRPKALVALGVTAMEGLFGQKFSITRVRGRFMDFRGIPVMPTYHPAYLLRNQAISEKRKVWEDMLQVMETIGLEITDKHRGYFLKKSG